MFFGKAIRYLYTPVVCRTGGQATRRGGEKSFAREIEQTIHIWLCYVWITRIHNRANGILMILTSDAWQGHVTTVFKVQYFESV